MSSNVYNSPAEAVIGLKERGYDLDMFELIEKSNDPEQFTIVEIHHFEGIINETDNCVFYALESVSGQKGIVVDLNGLNNTTAKGEVLGKIKIKQPE